MGQAATKQRNHAAMLEALADTPLEEAARTAFSADAETRAAKLARMLKAITGHEAEILEPAKDGQPQAQIDDVLFRLHRRDAEDRVVVVLPCTCCGRDGGYLASSLIKLGALLRNYEHDPFCSKCVERREQQLRDTYDWSAT